MGKYSIEVEADAKAASARGSDLRVHFKNSRETAKAIHGMSLAKAKSYLEDVMEHKRCIVFRRFCGGVGRTALAKNEGSTNGQVTLSVFDMIARSRRVAVGQVRIEAAASGCPVEAQWLPASLMCFTSAVAADVQAHLCMARSVAAAGMSSPSTAWDLGWWEVAR